MEHVVDKVFLDPVVKVGHFALTPEAILKSLTILLLAFLLAWGIRRLSRRVRARIGEARGSTVYIGAQVTRYIVVLAGIAAAISALGVDMSALSLFAGALGVGVGLGLQDVVRNFVCGIILLFDRSIEVGDFIETDTDTRGTVVAIGPRATTLVTPDNVDILLPNAQLLNGKLKNWTRNRTARRIHIPFGVAYGSDKELVKRAALEAAEAVSLTETGTAQQRTQVWLVGFGESALNFELVVWPTLEAVKRPGSMMAAYNWALDDALRKHGIEIPFPQRDLRLRGFFEHSGEDGLRSWRGEEAAGRRGPASAQGAGGASGNDAAGEIHEGSDGAG